MPRFLDDDRQQERQRPYIVHEGGEDADKDRDGTGLEVRPAVEGVEAVGELAHQAGILNRSRDNENRCGGNDGWMAEAAESLRRRY